MSERKQANAAELLDRLLTHFTDPPHIDWSYHEAISLKDKDPELVADLTTWLQVRRKQSD